MHTLCKTQARKRYKIKMNNKENENKQFFCATVHQPRIIYIILFDLTIFKVNRRHPTDSESKYIKMFVPNLTQLLFIWHYAMDDDRQKESIILFSLWIWMQYSQCRTQLELFCPVYFVFVQYDFFQFIFYYYFKQTQLATPYTFLLTL